MNATRAEEERARKYMLMGIDFVLRLLGVDRDGLLGRFVRQEFQTWVSDAISREAAARPTVTPNKARKSRATGAPPRG